MENSGKSSFIYALMGYMNKFSGNILQKNVSAFLPELPYLMANDTILDNILFYKTFDAYKYNESITIMNFVDLTTNIDLKIKYLTLTMVQAQKIGLSRSMFCDRYFTVQGCWSILKILFLFYLAM